MLNFLDLIMRVVRNLFERMHTGGDNDVNYVGEFNSVWF